MLPGPVLLVDDEPQVRMLLRTVLSKQGLETVEAGDGLSALSTLKTRHGLVSLMVCDYAMPGLNGAALASQVRAQFPAIPILFLSSDTKASECPFKDAFLAKPFLPAELVATVLALTARV